MSLRIARNRQNKTCPYRPNSGGLVERFNRTLKGMLAAFCADYENDWDDNLPILLMAYRVSEHDCTKCTLNLLMLRQRGR